jgi:hypothetical protein
VGGSSAGAAGVGGTSAGGSGGSGGSSGSSFSIAVNGNVCFTLATGATDTSAQCKGDLMFMVGGNVDLGAPGPQMPYCPQTGVFTSVDMVPTSYAGCAWTGYVEGIVGLADTGYILVDGGGHHYRMRIQSNTLPTLVFQLLKID